MTPEQREALLDLNEKLCREYNETDDETILEKIAVTEMIFLYDLDRAAVSTESADANSGRK